MSLSGSGQKEGCTDEVRTLSWAQTGTDWQVFRLQLGLPEVGG